MADFISTRFRCVLLLMVATPLSLAGCANPGSPKPPTLRLPEQPRGLTAERVGDHVNLSWTTSGDTTDGDAVRGPISALICRDDAPKAPSSTPIYPPPPNSCRPVHDVTAAPGSSETTDSLPESLRQGPPALIAYRVELLNVQGRSAGPSAPVYAVAGRAPAAVGPMTVQTRRGAALITWQRTAYPRLAPVEVTRTLLANAAGPVGRARKQKARDAPPAAPLRAGNAATQQQVTLTAEGDGTTDPGGMFDRSIHDGDTLAYTAQRVLRLELPTPSAVNTHKKGKSSGTKAAVQTFEMRGDPSPTVTFTFHDTLPPEAPAGLAAVPGGGFGEPPSVDLSWEPNAELDIAGYNVYRAPAGTDKFTRMNAQLVPGPSYRDLTAQPGRRYAYRVTAVDRHHNESSPSATLNEALRSVDR
jgi:hypothetical protein